MYLRSVCAYQGLCVWKCVWWYAHEYSLWVQKCSYVGVLWACECQWVHQWEWLGDWMHLWVYEYVYDGIEVWEWVSVICCEDWPGPSEATFAKDGRAQGRDDIRRAVTQCLSWCWDTWNDQCTLPEWTAGPPSHAENRIWSVSISCGLGFFLPLVFLDKEREQESFSSSRC